MCVCVCVCACVCKLCMSIERYRKHADEWFFYKWHACPGSDTFVLGLAGGGRAGPEEGVTDRWINGLGRQPGELYVGIPA